MPLLREGKIIENDHWVVLSDDTDLPDNIDHMVISLTRYFELHDNGAQIPKGVKVAPADDILALTPHIQKLKLIGIDFPVYTDGRGYSYARLLRKRLGYNGELRAMGDVRADQILFMMRSGIDSFDFQQEPDIQLLKAQTNRYKKNYQPSYPIPAL